MIKYLLWVVIHTYLVNSDLVALHQWTANVAHTDQVISINIYNDNSRFVSGSNDFIVKVWSMTDYSLLHT